MDQNLGIVRNASRSQHVERGGGTVHTLVTAVNDDADLGVAHLANQRFHFTAHLGIDHHHDVADAVAMFKGINAPAHDGLAAHGDKLLGIIGVEARTEAGGQHHGHHRHGLRRFGALSGGRLDGRRLDGGIEISLSHRHHRKVRAGRP